MRVEQDGSERDREVWIYEGIRKRMLRGVLVRLTGHSRLGLPPAFAKEYVGLFRGGEGSGGRRWRGAFAVIFFCVVFC